MAEIADSGGSGGGKHGKKGRKHAGSPRVDMTPMVDLAFLLLTFFVLTSNLNKAKTLEMAVPKDDPTAPKMEVDDDLANTFIIDGNKDGIIYYYHGRLVADSTELFELVLDPDAKLNIRKTIAGENKDIQEKMKFVRDTYKSGKLNQSQHSQIMGYVTEATAPNPNGKDPEVIAKDKQAKLADCTTRLNADLQKGEMSDSTYRKVSSTIRGADKAPFFIVKWGGDATYGEVINIVDELKIGDASKYALTDVSCLELQALQGYQASKGQPVRPYKKLNSKECAEPEPAP